MNNVWIDISECGEGYYLFVHDHVYNLKGKAVRIADINNTGEVVVEAKS